MAQLTDFGKTVKIRLIEVGKTQTWLVEQLHEKTGLFVDGGYLAKILTGERSPQKLIDAICEILSIPTEKKEDSA